VTKKIRVTETRIYEYTPDFDDEAYQGAGINDLEAALEFDKECVLDGEVGPVELGDDLPRVIHVWEIVDL